MYIYDRQSVSLVLLSDNRENLFKQEAEKQVSERGCMHAPCCDAIGPRFRNRHTLLVRASVSEHLAAGTWNETARRAAEHASEYGSTAHRPWLSSYTKA